MRKVVLYGASLTLSLLAVWVGASCSDEYCVRAVGSASVLVSGRICHAYSCENGTPAEGMPANHNEPRCASCNQGYRLVGAMCVPSAQICINGTSEKSVLDANGAPTAGTSEAHGESRCASCDFGYHLVDAMCAPNAHVCEHGTAEKGMPEAHEEPRCAKCEAGYRLVDAMCAPNTHACEHGIAEGGMPEAHEETRCAECKAGYSLIDAMCVVNTYTCENGTQIAGAPADIPAIGCERCADGYALVGTSGIGTACAPDTDRDGFYDGIDVDYNGNGLIEIATALELHNMRHNLAGTSYDDEADDGTGGGTGGGATAGDAGDTTGCGNGRDVAACSGYELMADIDLGVPLPGASSAHWSPIGDISAPFVATLEGNDRTISNLAVGGAASDVTALGFFGRLGRNGTTVTVRNLTFADATVARGGKNGSSCSFGTACGGVVAGQAYAVLRDIRATGTVRGATSASYDQALGGLVGVLEGGQMRNTHSMVAVSGGGEGSDYLGGLVGLQRSSSIIASAAGGAVSEGGKDEDFLGGLVGRQDGNISSSAASGAVSDGGAGVDYLGGLSGEQTGNISASSATGAVSDGGAGVDYLGGLVGQQSNGDISGAAAAGAVSGGGNGGDFLGGLVGAQEFETIENAIASGTVSGDANGANTVGALMGKTRGATTVDPATARKAYALGALSSGNNSDKVGGLVGRIANIGTGATALDARLSGYWNTQTTGQAAATATTATLNNVSARTTAQLLALTGNASPVLLLAAEWDFGTGTDYPGLRFDLDGDGASCVLRPVQTAATGNGATSAARFALQPSGDLDDPPCASFRAAHGGS